jgi:hypothetical protein
MLGEVSRMLDFDTGPHWRDVMARSLVVVIIALVVSLVGVGVWAQMPVPRPEPGPVHRLTLPTDVRSGEDIGVRLVGSVKPDGTIQGALVVKVNGQWVDVVPPVAAGR